jgi:hypothetical protein
MDQVAYYEWFRCQKGEEPPAEKVTLLKEYLDL